ncbi:bile acid:sodium symporter family protein [Desulfofundulus thermobenzoicus]|uniref:Bile acid:sodium symporter family protein n=1 Tax=Desulfofundulus thermobenzoicus TaxID=29376 RepID=A0A6N7IQV2_9FIRM|nr:bile acid:sodium symporter [Desulfofundulus thermobenzoicus]MQL51973.1 bile acid:sodium symporter family protein [Desulfofundulus thermobenzoicus]
MLKRLSCWNAWLGRHMFYVVLSALLVGFTLPLPSSPSLSKLAVALFAYMTFITALDTSFKDFLHVLARPWVALWVLVLIHGVMPLLAWGVGLVFYPQDSLIRLGFLIGASIPIGVTSIIWTSLVHGDVPLALVAVTADTLVSPFLLPLFLALVAGRAVHIDYVHMLTGLLWMVTIPSLLGMAIKDLTRHRLDQFARSFGGFTSKVALFWVVFINASAVAPEIHWNLSLVKMLLVVLLQVSCGYYLGYLGSLALPERRRDTVAAMVYNVGMRNISFGAVLAVSFFPPAVAVPVTLGMLYQQPLAAVVSHLFNRFDRRKICTAELSGSGSDGFSMRSE